MNFLAHLYLSGENEPLMIGNFIGDFVKGRVFEQFNHDIKRGILLHRKIDEFTDTHPIVLQTKQRLRPRFRHYSAVISDIFYDHFLSALWSNYHAQPLMEYTQHFYQLTKKYASVIPPKAGNMIYYMEKGNWLYHYQFMDGIRQALTGMARRARFDSGMEQADEALSLDYQAYQQEFEAFFPELIGYCQVILKTL